MRTEQTAMLCWLVDSQNSIARDAERARISQRLWFTHKSSESGATVYVWLSFKKMENYYEKQSHKPNKHTLRKYDYLRILI
jgi:hypothetical protein